MIKLFVALDLPTAIKQGLALLQPQANPSTRLVSKDQLHLTLHYIGDADLQATINTLNKVHENNFTLTIKGLGKFTLKNGKTVLWARVQETEQLHRLQYSIASLLSSDEKNTDTKAFIPHITLARCGANTPRDIINQFLEQDKEVSLPDINITHFGLYESRVENNMLVYNLKKDYQLGAN